MLRAKITLFKEGLKTLRFYIILENSKHSVIIEPGKNLYRVLKNLIFTSNYRETKKYFILDLFFKNLEDFYNFLDRYFLESGKKTRDYSFGIKLYIYLILCLVYEGVISPKEYLKVVERLYDFANKKRVFSFSKWISNEVRKFHYSLEYRKIKIPRFYVAKIGNYFSMGFSGMLVLVNSKTLKTYIPNYLTFEGVLDYFTRYENEILFLGCTREEVLDILHLADIF